MGAIYLDLGYATARKTVLNIVTPYIEDPNVTFFNDYKSVLQEVVQTEKKTVAYELIDENVRDYVVMDDHFVVLCKIKRDIAVM